jgi:CheY-like chemotaxis protein
MPVILLMDKHSPAERKDVREWFENSRFLTLEASNVFEALEEISDFTIEKRPDVVLLDVDCCEDDLPRVRDMTGFDDTAIMALSPTRPLSQVKTYLDKMIPLSGAAKSQPAA